MIEIIVAMEKERAVLRMPDKLKPCPFCGSENVAFTLDDEQQMENTEWFL